MFTVGRTYSVATREGTAVMVERMTVLEVNLPLVRFERANQKPLIMNTAALTFVSAEETDGGRLDEMDADFLALIPGAQSAVK